MRDYVIKRIFQGLLLVICVSFLVFCLMYAMPGDPIDMLVDRKVSEERKAEIAHEYGLDQPFMTQYVNWIDGIVHGDFGDSVRGQERCVEPDRAEDPLQLKALRMVAGTGDSGGFAAGFALRHEKGRISGPVHSKLFNAHGGSAVLLAWRPVHTSVRCLAGMAANKRIQQRPALYPAGGSTVLASMGGTLRLTKSEVLDVFNEKYVTTAYAKGLPKKTVMIKHVLRNALILVTTLVFMSIPWLISGAVVIENMFGLPGMGNLLLNSIKVQDFPIVQAVLLLIAILTVLCNLASDILMGVLDPRIRLSLSGGDK